MIAELQITARRLREAVARADHTEACRRLAEYRRRIDELAAGLPAGDPGASLVLTEALDLIQWARTATLSRRAQCAQQLTRLQSPAPYRPAAPARPSAITLEG